MSTPGMISLWPKLLYTLFVGVLVPVYWRHYGPVNFLWFSDIALLGGLLALWLESAWLASMMALSVALLEIAWNLDFFVHLLTGVQLLGLSTYMFETKISLSVRALSLFHVALPLLLIWLVARLGYEPRALAAQTVVAWIVLPLSRLLATPSQNVNWVYGFGDEARSSLPVPLYFGLLMLGFPVLVYVPTHFTLKKLFGTGGF